jgi:hypothetical protein
MTMSLATTAVPSDRSALFGSGSIFAMRDDSTADMLEQWADAVIDRHRFGCDEDRVLARWDESDVDALMPSSDDLSEIGFDIVGLAKALESGLNAELFGKAYRLLDITEFNVALAAGLDIALYNEGLDHLADIAAEDA